MSSEIDITRFRGALKESGIDQTELAKRVGCTPGAINQIASGKTRKSRLLPEISAELGVSLEWLLGKTVERSTGASFFQLSPSEQSLVDMIRAMDAGDRAAVMQIARSLTDRHRPTLHDSKFEYYSKNEPN